MARAARRPRRPGDRPARRGVLPDPGGQGALRSWVRLSNEGAAAGHGRVRDLVPVRRPVKRARRRGAPDDLGRPRRAVGENDWLAEGRWQRRALRDALPDLNRRRARRRPARQVRPDQPGTWSSGALPADGRGRRRRTGHAWAWQIEHNGAWHWQVGRVHPPPERPPDPAARSGTAAPGAASGAYVAAARPADAEHHWHVTLAPGERSRPCRPPSRSATTDSTAPWPGSPRTGAPSGARTTITGACR